MTLSPLLAISPIDGRYTDQTSQLQQLCSEYGLIYHRVWVEIAWLQSLSKHEQIKEVAPLQVADQNFLENIVNQFSLNDAIQVKTIEKKINHDVKAVEYFIKEKLSRHKHLAALNDFVHFACTSEDINNLAYALIIQTTREKHLLPLLRGIIKSLRKQAHSYANVAMLSRTHGQAATPTTIGKEMANFTARLKNQYQQLIAIKIKGKFNGAVGNFNAHCISYPEIDWLSHCQAFVRELGLDWNGYTTQIEPHDYIAELAHTLIRIHNILIDYARDMWGYISLGYFRQRTITHEVGSSTMPHKVNPIDFENAEGNLLLANKLLSHFANELTTSRWQRDLTDSTLIRNLGVSFAHSIIAYSSLNKGIEKLEVNQSSLDQDLNNHWEILTEAIQTVMRRYGLSEGYEQLKQLSRGEKIDQNNLHKFIDTLGLPKSIKKQLKDLTPQQYIGYADKLAREI